MMENPKRKFTFCLQTRRKYLKIISRSLAKMNFRQHELERFADAKDVLSSSLFPDQISRKIMNSLKAEENSL